MPKMPKKKSKKLIHMLVLRAVLSVFNNFVTKSGTSHEYYFSVKNIFRKT